MKHVLKDARRPRHHRGLCDIIQAVSRPLHGLLVAVGVCSCQSHPTSGSSTSRANGPTPSASLAAPAAADASAVSAEFSCFSWVHGPESFSTDCFRTASDCEKARQDMTAGGRPTTPACDRAERAWCVVATRPPAPAEFERCFGDPGACERYRAFISKSGHRVSACALPKAAQ